MESAYYIRTSDGKCARGGFFFTEGGKEGDDGCHNYIEGL
jgi:hypothetical protein